MASSSELERLSCQELIRKLQYLFDTNQEEDVDEALDWFLFTYSPEHAFSLVQKNSEALKDPILLEIAMSKIREIYEPEIFLETVNVISSLEGYEQEIARSGIVNSVVVMMGRDIDNARSQALGCKVLANLSCELQVREWIGKVRGITKLLDACKRHRTAAEVVIEVFRAIANLTFCCKPNKEVTVNEHGVETILETMEVHKTNAKLINCGLRALRNIVRNLDMIMELQQHTLIREVTVTMSNHRAISDIQANCIWILIGLLSGKAELKKYIPEQGAVEPLLQAMETHKADNGVQLAGTTALALMAKVASNRLLISSKNGISILISAMQTHRDSVPILRSAIKALFRLSFNKIIRERMGDDGCVKEVVESMKMHPRDPPLQRMAIICLLQFSKSTALRDLIQKDAVSYIIQARNRFYDIPHVQSIAFQAVESLVIHTTGGDPDTILIEIRNIREDLKAKDTYIEKLQSTLVRLKPEVITNKRSESKITNENSKDINQREFYLEEIKKTENQVKMIFEELEITKIKLRDEEKKLVEILKKKKAMMEESEGKKKVERKSSKNMDQKPPGKGEGKGGKEELKPKEDTKPKDVTDPKENKDKNKNKGLSPDVHKKSQKEEPKSNSKKPVETEVHPKKMASTNSNELEKKKSIKGKDKDRKRRDTKIPNEMMGSSGSIPKKIVSDPSLPEIDNPTINVSLLSDSYNRISPNKPPVERTNSRTLQRLAHQARGIQKGSNNEDVLHLHKELENLSRLCEVKEKEIETNKEEKKKLENQVIKLNTDLKGAHILIQALQKESLIQTQNREKMKQETINTDGNSLYTRHQKKIQSLKERVQATESENNELRKEIKKKKKGKDKDDSKKGD